MWERRTGSGTPVVLIHGLSGSARWWSRNIEALAEHHLVAAVDLVGFGHNFLAARPKLLPPFGEVTALLARWIETFGEPVHVIGHSMGGELAIRLAAERPELVHSLVLVNAAGVPFTMHPAPHLRAITKAPLTGASIARVLVPDFLRAGPTSVAVASARVLRGDAREWMARIAAPALLVWGEGDPLVPVSFGEQMASLIPGAKLVVLPRAAHVAMWDNAEEFNRVVLQFIRDAENAPPCAVTDGAFCWGISGWTYGIAHRQAGTRRNVVLIHGLGMSSAYFSRFARALYARGLHPIAPDLPGFGESANGPGASPEAHARILARWADSLSIRNATWIGHSIGCNTVAHLAALRPDLCSRAVMIGPLWSRRRFAITRMFFCLALDALREPFRLYRYVIPAYWRTGLARWCVTMWRYAPDMRAGYRSDLMIAGSRDPIPDRTSLAVATVPGAHACHFSHPDETAEAAYDDGAAEGRGAPSDTRPDTRKT